MHTSFMSHSWENEKNEWGTTTGLPNKWSHQEFPVELVYDLTHPGKVSDQLSVLCEMDDESILSAGTALLVLNVFNID